MRDGNRLHVLHRDGASKPGVAGHWACFADRELVVAGSVESEYQRSMVLEGLLVSDESSTRVTQVSTR